MTTLVLTSIVLICFAGIVWISIKLGEAKQSSKTEIIKNKLNQNQDLVNKMNKAKKNESKVDNMSASDVSNELHKHWTRDE